MKQSLLITIGIPVYGVEAYIEKCILSVLAQTYKNLEILVIDDCGKDQSIDIVRRIVVKEQDHRFKIIRHDCNKGLGEARNTVIEHAQGDYIYFLDSDDWIEPYAIEKMVAAVEGKNPDVVYASSYAIDFRDGIRQPNFTYEKPMEISGQDAFAQFICRNVNWQIGWSVWNVLFRVDWLREHHLRFVTRKNEDLLFISDYYPLVQHAIMIPDYTYNYLIRPGSIMAPQKRDVIPVWEIKIQFQNDAYMTQRSDRLRDKSYFDVHCAKVMKHKFRTVCVALKHRKLFDGPVTDRELRDNMNHPATFSDILGFKRYRMLNLFFYFLGVIPPVISVAIAQFVGKKKQWI